MATENISKGQYYRILKNKASDIWDRISLWTHADDVELNNGSTLTSDLSAKETKINKLFTNFAPVESTSRATRAYSAGQCLIWNNQFYRAITSISVNTAFSVGGNIQVMSASEISTMLTASDGVEFYFDKRDGQYGFYPNANKTASEFVPFGGGLSETVLWTNPNPTSGAGEIRATLSESIDSYEYIGIDYRRATTYPATARIIIPVENFKTELTFGFFISSYVPSTGYLSRLVQYASGTSVIFSPPCQWNGTYQELGWCIPTIISGLK